MAPTTTRWQLDPHTAAKHELLRRYLDAWLPVMAQRRPRPGRVIVMDGFAGPGVYSNGEEGSPLIALRALIDHTAADRMGDTIYSFVFFEDDPERFASLQEQISRLKTEYEEWPANIRIHPTEAMSFVTGGEWLLGQIGEKARLAPIFAFVDPFGVSGLPLDLIRRLCQFEGAEVFINYMRNTVQRFAGAGNIDHHLRELFGNDDYAEADQHPDRQDRLRELYPERLRQECRFDFTLGFEMVNQTGQSYDLVYGTRSLKGVEKMKDAMWKVDPTGAFKFEDRKYGLLSLLEGPPMRDPLVRRALVDRFAGAGPTAVATINRHILVETPFAATHWKKPLGQLEDEGRVAIVSTPSAKRRPRTFVDGTVVQIT
jgi:three-Cys-motif partner protein